ALSFVIRHKVGSNNQVTDALSPRHSLITTMQIRVQGFDSFRGIYCDDLDFREIWSKCENGGLAGHFGRDKTLALLHEQFYWPRMERDEDVILDFVLGLSRFQQAKDSFMVDVDRFLKMAHFVPCLKMFDASQVARSVNRTTSKSYFEVIYERNSITPLDLVPIPDVGRFSEEGANQSEKIKELHRSVQEQLSGKMNNTRNMRISVVNMFCIGRIELPGYYNVSATFNVADLCPYKGDSDNEPDSGSSLFQEGDDDADAIRVQGFDSFRGLYCDDPGFREIWSKCDNGGLAGHFGRDKTLALLHEQFYWPRMKRDVNRILKRCRHATLQLIVVMQRAKDSVMVVVDRFLKMAHFVPCSKMFDASQVASLYFAKIMKLHVVPKTLTYDRDVKFVSHFWRTLWTRLGSKL
nr:hypothetical protein [Tanacetum cinerariifolium]